MNGKPTFVRLGNTNLKLHFVNDSWKMWIPDYHDPKINLGFMFRPKNLDCPENALVDCNVVSCSGITTCTESMHVFREFLFTISLELKHNKL